MVLSRRSELKLKCLYIKMYTSSFRRTILAKTPTTFAKKINEKLHQPAKEIFQNSV